MKHMKCTIQLQSKIVIFNNRLTGTDRSGAPAKDGVLKALPFFVGLVVDGPDGPVELVEVLSPSHADVGRLAPGDGKGAGLVVEIIR